MEKLTEKSFWEQMEAVGVWFLDYVVDRFIEWFVPAVAVCLAIKLSGLMCALQLGD